MESLVFPLDQQARYDLPLLNWRAFLEMTNNWFQCSFLRACDYVCRLVHHISGTDSRIWPEPNKKQYDFAPYLGISSQYGGRSIFQLALPNDPGQLCAYGESRIFLVASLLVILFLPDLMINPHIECRQRSQPGGCFTLFSTLLSHVKPHSKSVFCRLKP